MAEEGESVDVPTSFGTFTFRNYWVNIGATEWRGEILLDGTATPIQTWLDFEVSDEGGGGGSDDGSSGSSGSSDSVDQSGAPLRHVRPRVEYHGPRGSSTAPSAAPPSTTMVDYDPTAAGLTVTAGGSLPKLGSGCFCSMFGDQSGSCCATKRG